MRAYSYFSAMGSQRRKRTRRKREEERMNEGEKGRKKKWKERKGERMKKRYGKSFLLLQISFFLFGRKIIFAPAKMRRKEKKTKRKRESFLRRKNIGIFQRIASLFKKSYFSPLSFPSFRQTEKRRKEKKKRKGRKR